MHNHIIMTHNKHQWNPQAQHSPRISVGVRRLFGCLVLDHGDYTSPGWNFSFDSVSCQKTLDITVKNGQQAKRSQRSHSVHWRLSHQRPVSVSQKRCDHHWLIQCSLYGLNLQLDNGGGSSHPCSLLGCLSSLYMTRLSRLSWPDWFSSVTDWVTTYSVAWGYRHTQRQRQV